jgi:hypothetical protein
MKEETLERRLLIRVTASQYAQITKYARKAKVKPSTMARNLLLTGMDSAEFMNKVGILDLVGFFRENEIKPIDLLQLADTIV